MATILSFISTGITLLFFSLEAGNIARPFVDKMRCANTKLSIQKMLAARYTVEDWLFTLVICMAAWELWLSAAAQHHKRTSRSKWLAQGKIKRSKFEVQFLLSVCYFGTIVKLKTRKLHYPKSGTVCITSFNVDDNHLCHIVCVCVLIYIRK